MLDCFQAYNILRSLITRVKNMNKKEAYEDMQSLYTCEDCYERPAVVKVSGSFTCYECWAKVEASHPPALILNKPVKETEQ